MTTSLKPCPAPDRQPRTPRLSLERGSCDCHAHVIGPAARYPLSDQRIYTPPDCVAADYRHLLATLGVSRAVLVQPSVYGDDNRLLLDTLQNDPCNLRGVAVISPQISVHDLANMHAAGVRGARVNLVDRHDHQASLPMEDLHALANRIAPLGWHLELLVHVNQHAAQLPALGQLAVPVVFGHFGYLSDGAGIADPGFQAMLSLMRAGRAWVKLTGPYRLTTAPLPYPGCDALAQALRDSAPHRLIWGTDWPHVMLRGQMPNDADLVDLLDTWLPDAALRRQVLVDNPQQLYGFERP